MMKKKYIKPEMKVYEVGTQQLMAGSQEENFRIGGRTADDDDDMW